VSTFFNLKEFADFEADFESVPDTGTRNSLPRADTHGNPPPSSQQLHDETNSLGLNLSYTINLNLPETTDVNVYNAIFEAVRKNLLGRN
jgi:hypothetical protein